jgi:hypothetical protein
MAYTGVIKFIFDSSRKAIVKQTVSGKAYADGYRVVNADFSAKANDQSITYTYNAASTFNDSRDITIS